MLSLEPSGNHPNQKLMSRLIRLIDQINEFIGSSVAWLTLFMMIITCIVVVIRYALNLGSIALQESVMYLHGTLFMLGIGYTLKNQGHVRVDVLYTRFSVKHKALVDLFGTVVFLMPLSIFLFLASLDYVAFSWSLREGSAQPGGLPGVFLLKTLLPLMAGLLFLQGLSELAKSIVALRSDPGTAIEESQ